MSDAANPLRKSPPHPMRSIAWWYGHESNCASKDGARIEWVIIQGEGKNTVHLGISTSDNSYWRFRYGAGTGIEAATKDEAKQLDEIRQDRTNNGTKAQDFVHE